MTASSDLVERSGDLKRELIEFSHQRRFDRPARKAVEERFGRYPVLSEEEAINFQDWFALQARLPDGRTVVEHFVAAHPELPEQERAMLLGWRDVVEGLFEVKRRDGEALLLDNLVDDLAYRARANVGPAIFSGIPRGSFVTARLVPIADEWLLSGATTLLPASGRAEVYQTALELSAQFPALVFRNPEKLAQGWELQREERRSFVDFFGSDTVVLPGREVGEQMQAFMRYRTYEARDADGTTAAERAQKAHGVLPPEVDHPTPPEFLAAETVGMIYDEIEGLSYFIDFGAFADVFANPNLAADRERRQVVRLYLEDDSVSPLPLRRMAERDPERASQVFQRVLQRPRFSWERDGEALLRKHKAWFYEQPQLPTAMPVSDRLARAARITAPRDHPRPDYRPARRRKKGSWQKGGRPH